MLKAVLCDLDNTLIIYDEARFFKDYFRALAAKFSDVLPEDKFIDRLWKSTLATHDNDGSVINRRAFLDSFCKDLDMGEEAVWKRFDDFYASEYDRFGSMIIRPGQAREVIEDAQRKGLKLVIATNPVWPLAAQMTRLSWAGLDDIEYTLITHIDNTSFCKPKIGYYEDICGKIGERPQDCLMVGNDFANDMVAAMLGMKTYLAEDSLKHIGTPLSMSSQLSGRVTDGIPPADFTGPLAGLTQAIETLLR